MSLTLPPELLVQALNLVCKNMPQPLGFDPAPQITGCTPTVLAQLLAKTYEAKELYEGPLASHQRTHQTLLKGCLVFPEARMAVGPLLPHWSRVATHNSGVAQNGDITDTWCQLAKAIHQDVEEEAGYPPVLKELHQVRFKKPILMEHLYKCRTEPLPADELPLAVVISSEAQWRGKPHRGAWEVRFYGLLMHEGKLAACALCEGATPLFERKVALTS